MMVPEVKVQLLDALRSGEYEKGTGFLKKDSYEGSTALYCCLGVLSDLASKQDICNPFVKNDSGAGYLIKEMVKDSAGFEYEEHHGAYLSDKVAAWSGLSNDDQVTLANINDSSTGFGEVIEYIDTNL